MLSFQRLDVYQRAIEFLALVCEIVADLPRGNADRADQLVERRSPWCATLPKGRAAGRRPTVRVATKLRAARRWNARRRSMWCGCARWFTDARYERGIHLLEGVVAMLTKMV